MGQSLVNNSDNRTRDRVTRPMTSVSLVPLSQRPKVLECLIYKPPSPVDSLHITVALHHSRPYQHSRRTTSLVPSCESGRSLPPRQFLLSRLIYSEYPRTLYSFSVSSFTVRLHFRTRLQVSVLSCPHKSLRVLKPTLVLYLSFDLPFVWGSVVPGLVLPAVPRPDLGFSDFLVNPRGPFHGFKKGDLKPMGLVSTLKLVSEEVDLVQPSLGTGWWGVPTVLPVYPPSYTSQTDRNIRFRWRKGVVVGSEERGHSV